MASVIFFNDVPSQINQKEEQDEPEDCPDQYRLPRVASEFEDIILSKKFC